MQALSAYNSGDTVPLQRFFIVGNWSIERLEDPPPPDNVSRFLETSGYGPTDDQVNSQGTVQIEVDSARNRFALSQKFSSPSGPIPVLIGNTVIVQLLFMLIGAYLPRTSSNSAKNNLFRHAL
jgi:hypothetical protein